MSFKGQGKKNYLMSEEALFHESTVLVNFTGLKRLISLSRQVIDSG